jgi:hypothetical protein
MILMVTTTIKMNYSSKKWRQLSVNYNCHLLYYIKGDNTNKRANRRYKAKSATTRTGNVIHKLWFRITYFLYFVHNHVFKQTYFFFLDWEALDEAQKPSTPTWNYTITIILWNSHTSWSFVAYIWNITFHSGLLSKMSVETKLRVKLKPQGMQLTCNASHSNCQTQMLPSTNHKLVYLLFWFVASSLCIKSQYIEWW